MLTISSKVIYAISAMYELSLTQKGQCLQIKEIAHAQNIPISFLEQILRSLRKAGLIQSIRGAQGGYKLLRDAEDIIIIDIIQAIEGNIKLLSTNSNLEILNDYFNELESQIIDFLKLSLKDFVKQRKIKSKQDMFHI